ncbi:POT family [Musa troglodytarum]|uniref:POT family n=1 Tax=Musa troglodytarum TaxID=320322 RepID=A0A9E7KPZ2_9LILI|nr:POT family [Musa troglodytarum]
MWNGLPASSAPSGLVLRLPLPGGNRPRRAHALRTGLRREPVRPARHPGPRRQELLLQLVVLRNLLRRRGHRPRPQLRPGQHRLGPWVRNPLHRYAVCPRAVRARNQDLPLLPLAGGEPLRSDRQNARRIGKEEAGKPSRYRTAIRAASASPLTVPHMDDVFDLRRWVRAVLDSLHQPRRDTGQEDRVQASGAAGGAAEFYQRLHHRLHPHLRRHPRPRGSEVLRASFRHHHAAEDRHRDGSLPRLHGDSGSGGDEAAQNRPRVRFGGSAQRSDPDELVVAGASVCSFRGGRRLHHGRPAGVLLRPSPRCIEEPGAGSLPEHLRHRQLHQRIPDLCDQQNDGRRGRELVFQQSQPCSSRLLLLASCGAQHDGATSLRVLHASLCVQEKAGGYRSHVVHLPEHE